MFKVHIPLTTLAVAVCTPVRNKNSPKERATHKLRCIKLWSFWINSFLLHKQGNEWDIEQNNYMVNEPHFLANLNDKKNMIAPIKQRKEMLQPMYVM